MTESIIDHDLLQKFMDEVLFKLLPNAHWKMVGGMYPAHAKRAGYVNVSLADSREVYSNSIFDYQGSYKFIHYTSLSSLIAIMRSKSLRMYQLTSMDDLQEFDFACNYLGIKSSYRLNSIKEKLFTLSMCKYELESREQSLDQWRQYGADGFGCGIVLKFRKSNRHKWIHYLLSTIHYGERKLEVIKQYLDDYTKFRSQYPFSISNHEELIYPLLCFYKQSFYQSEKEVRLIFNNGTEFHSQQNRKPKVDLNRRGERVYFTDLELENERWKNLEWPTPDDLKILKVIYPYVTVDEIIFGYRVPENTKYECCQVIRELCNETPYKKTPKFSNSKLTAYF